MWSIFSSKIAGLSKKIVQEQNNPEENKCPGILSGFLERILAQFNEMIT